MSDNSLDNVFVSTDLERLQDEFPEAEYFIKRHEVFSNITLWIMCPGREHARLSLEKLVPESRDKSLYFGGVNFIFHEFAVFDAEMNQLARIVPMGQIEGYGQFAAILKRLKQESMKRF